MIQSVAVCPGDVYGISFATRRVTSVGTISVLTYLNDKLVNTYAATSTWTQVSSATTYVVPAGVTAMTVRFEFVYGSGTGVQKEAYLDNVALTRPVAQAP